MPNPKRRHSKHRKRIRRSHDSIVAVQLNHCPRCSAPVRTHRVCDNCGYYAFDKGGQKGLEVVQKEEV